jgi:hypothetical protein
MPIISGLRQTELDDTPPPDDPAQMAEDNHALRIRLAEANLRLKEAGLRPVIYWRDVRADAKSHANVILKNMGAEPSPLAV